VIQTYWIREGRKALGLSQGKLGEKIGVTQVQVSQWETGKAEPSSEQAERLKELFGNPAPTTEPAAKAVGKQRKAKNGNGRAGASKKQKSFEQTLWDTADRLRGSVESSEYKHVVLSLIFLKFISDKFEERRRELIAEGKEAYVDMVEFYTMKNVFYLPEESRWSFIQKNAKQDDIAVKIDTALHTVEKNNKSLRGALPDNYFSRLGIQVSKLAALIDSIDNIDTVADKEEDVVGRVYEYFLGKFAATEGKGGGEFYTPKCVVNLIAEMIEPFRGKIYDPCCGSGGMFVQSVKFVESHQGNKKDVSIYGQELTATTYKLAKMNLAIRGIAANLGDVPADTFFRDQHPDLKADFIMANPPFNLDQWRGADELIDDPRWAGYDVPPTGNANYAWILHMISKLSENGVAGFVLANGSMSTNTRGEGAIRRKMIENDLVDCMIALPGQLFYTTQIPVCLWFITKNKKAMTAPTRS
jgi:type I restriction enzyme M protein